MTITDPNDLPSLSRAFGHNAYLMKTFHNADITSVIPLMLLPRFDLISDIKGIGERTATCVAKTLAGNGLEQRTFHERMTDFIDRRFGCIEDAPIGVLTVVTLRHTIGETVIRRPHYTPLQLIQLLEEINPHLKVIDLLELSDDAMMRMLEEHVIFGPILHRLRGDLTDVNWRLHQWDPAMKIGALASTKRRSHLALVNK